MAYNNNETINGDITGTLNSSMVVKIQGNPVQAATLGVSQDGYIATWSNTDGQIEFKPAATVANVSLVGDVTGLSNSNTVSKIRGNLVSAVAPTDAQILIEQTGGTGSAWKSLSQDATITDAGVVTVVSSAGNFTVGGNLTVNGTETIVGSTIFQSNATVDGYLTVTGAVTAASLKDTAFTSVGVVHNDASGNFTSSLISDADVSSAAAIAVSKLATGTNGYVLQTNGTTNAWTAPANTKIQSLQTIVITASYTVNSGSTPDCIILCNASTPITVSLPSSPNVGDTYYVKDKSGNASTNNITVSGNGKNIDGNSTYPINRNYESASFTFDSSAGWNLI